MHESEISLYSQVPPRCKIRRLYRICALGVGEVGILQFCPPEGYQAVLLGHAMKLEFHKEATLLSVLYQSIANKTSSGRVTICPHWLRQSWFIPVFWMLLLTVPPFTLKIDPDWRKMFIVTQAKGSSSSLESSRLFWKKVGGMWVVFMGNMSESTQPWTDLKMRR